MFVSIQKEDKLLKVPMPDKTQLHPTRDFFPRYIVRSTPVERNLESLNSQLIKMKLEWKGLKFPLVHLIWIFIPSKTHDLTTSTQCRISLDS